MDYELARCAMSQDDRSSNVIPNTQEIPATEVPMSNVALSQKKGEGKSLLPSSLGLSTLLKRASSRRLRQFTTRRPFPDTRSVANNGPPQLRRAPSGRSLDRKELNSNESAGELQTTETDREQISTIIDFSRFGGLSRPSRPRGQCSLRSPA
jgi:hypothetical protein